jgi:hypothetical protein
MSADETPPPGPASAAGMPDLSPEGQLAAAYECLDNLQLGFDLKVLKVLDDPEATPAMIERLKDELTPVVATRLYAIANSVRFGKNRSGKITRFAEVVNHLGMKFTKSTAIYLGLLALAITEEMRRVFARCFATSKLVEALAPKLHLPDQERTLAALGGLFIEIGKAIILMSDAQRQAPPDPDFLERHYHAVNVRLIEKFELPELLREIVAGDPFSFVKKDDLSLAAIVELAHGAVERSFARHGKLVVRSHLPDPDGIVYLGTAGSALAEQFQLAGLGAYLQVIPLEFSDVQKRLLEKHRR